MTRIGNRDHMYRVGNLVWSDRAPETKNHQAALDYCVAQGGRLPTRAELEALSRALGFPDRYDRNRIPNTTTTASTISRSAVWSKCVGEVRRRQYVLHKNKFAV